MKGASEGDGYFVVALVWAFWLGQKTLSTLPNSHELRVDAKAPIRDKCLKNRRHTKSAPIGRLSFPRASPLQETSSTKVWQNARSKHLASIPKP